MIKNIVAATAILLITGCTHLTTEEKLRGGSAEDIHSLGLMYFHGMGVSKNIGLGIKHLELAAEKGSVGAKYKLGIIYDDAKEMKKAIHWYSKAAEAPNMGHPMYRLAEIYHHGIGVDKNIDSAINYYLKTAKLGYESSMRELSRLYFEKKEYENSYVWAKVVQISGAKDARLQVDLASFKLKPLRVLELEKKAKVYARKYLHRA